MENLSNHRLSDTQLQELYVNCVKMAAENKISVNNTWDFKLIEHLDDLVKPMRADDGQVHVLHGNALQYVVRHVQYCDESFTLLSLLHMHLMKGKSMVR
jgi:hypothetical protein